MLPVAANDPVIMNEHAYYERSVNESSSVFEKEWVIVFVFMIAVFSASKFAHACYKKYTKRAPLIPEEMV